MASTNAVVGGSAVLTAKLWTAAEARRQHAPLHIVIVNDDPLRAESAGKAAQKAAQACRQQAPGLDVIDEVATGRPVDELLHRSKQARVLVVRSRGGGGSADAVWCQNLSLGR